MPWTGSPKTRARPSGGISSPAATLSSVDLPQPDGPTIATKVPSAISSEMSRRTVCTSPAGVGKRTVTPSNATAGVLMAFAALILAMRAGRYALVRQTELLARGLRELVVVGLGHVDLGVRDLGIGAGEHIEHRLSALRVHFPIDRVLRQRVLERRKIERLV